MFVILSAAMPSRLLKAFPPGVPISRLPLDAAIDRVAAFLPSPAADDRAVGDAATTTIDLEA
jgi:ATP-dependent DNA helicase DinG